MKIRKLLLTLISVSLLTTSVFAYDISDVAACDDYYAALYAADVKASKAMAIHSKISDVVIARFIVYSEVLAGGDVLVSRKTEKVAAAAKKVVAAEKAEKKAFSESVSRLSELVRAKALFGDCDSNGLAKYEYAKARRGLLEQHGLEADQSR